MLCGSVAVGCMDPGYLRAQGSRVNVLSLLVINLIGVFGGGGGFFVLESVRGL